MRSHPAFLRLIGLSASRSMYPAGEAEQGRTAFSESQARRNVVAFIPLANRDRCGGARRRVRDQFVTRFRRAPSRLSCTASFFDAFAPLLFLIVYGVARIVRRRARRTSELALAPFCDRSRLRSRPCWRYQSTLLSAGWWRARPSWSGRFGLRRRPSDRCRVSIRRRRCRDPFSVS